jgi:hypothetical protein
MDWVIVVLCMCKFSGGTFRSEMYMEMDFFVPACSIGEASDLRAKPSDVDAFLEVIQC